MKVLIACEKFGVVCSEMRKLGIDAYSCDLQPTKGNLPKYHIQGDALEIIKENWGAVIAFPPCNNLSVSGAHAFKKKIENGEQLKSINFFMSFVNSKIKIKSIENSIGIMSTIYRKPDQIIQPYMFGHSESKATCLWLFNLPKLEPTKFADFKKYRCKCGNVFDTEYGKYHCCDYPAKILWDNQTKSGQNKLPPTIDRADLRGKTYLGIAEAMANQWQRFLK